MHFVDEMTIEKIVEKLGNNAAAVQNLIDNYSSTEPALLGYFFSEDTHAFTNPEREWMLFLLMVILESSKVNSEKEVFSEKIILDTEEKNWTILQQSSGKTFRDRLDIFFDNYKQEDLLAFVEDSVTDTEDEIISKEGREPMFIMLKTIIDVLIEHH